MEGFRIPLKMQNVRKKMTIPKRKIGHWMCYNCYQNFFNIITCNQLVEYMAHSSMSYYMVSEKSTSHSKISWNCYKENNWSSIVLALSEQCPWIWPKATAY